jgi:hypothetical protein
MTDLREDLTTCDFDNNKPTQLFLKIEDFCGVVVHIRIMKVCNECAKKIKQMTQREFNELIRGQRKL